MNSPAVILALLVGSASLLPLSAFAQPAPGQFDGIWRVRVSCPSNTEESGAKGYNYDFSAKVENGVFSGSSGAEGTVSSLKIEGQISPDGNAELRASGRTGNPDYAVKKPTAGTPYTYRIKARFDRASGTGTRMEARVCNFTFNKQ